MFFIDYDDTLVTLLEAFFANAHIHTNTQTQKGIALPLLRMRTQGNKTMVTKNKNFPYLE